MSAGNSAVSFFMGLPLMCRCLACRNDAPNPRTAIRSSVDHFHNLSSHHADGSPSLLLSRLLANRASRLTIDPVLTGQPLSLTGTVVRDFMRLCFDTRAGLYGTSMFNRATQSLQVADFPQPEGTPTAPWLDPYPHATPCMQPRYAAILPHSPARGTTQDV